MTETQTSQTIRPNHVAAITTHNGQRLGHVVCKGRTFRAIRKHGSTGDIRRMASGFRSLAAAVAWVEAAA